MQIMSHPIFDVTLCINMLGQKKMHLFSLVGRVQTRFMIKKMGV